MLGYGADQYSAVDAQVSNVFDSKTVASDLAADPALTGLKVTEWQAQNSDLLSALKSQSSSSYMIQFFVLVAVALGIASTLAISAVQKTRQIGILKAMGMKDRQTGRIFLWQALILGVSAARRSASSPACCSSPRSPSRGATTRRCSPSTRRSASSSSHSRSGCSWRCSRR